MKPTELSRAIVAPPGRAIDEIDRDGIRHRLVTGVDRAVGRLPEGEELEITPPVLRRALAHPELLLGAGEPFAWQPKFVRRSLGLAVVRACAEGHFRSPAEAVGPIASEAVAAWASTGWKAFYWEPWFAGLTPGGQALALAEAVNWSTGVWTSLDWAVLGPGLSVGGPDDRWVLPVRRRVRLKGRYEMRVATTASDDDAAQAARGTPSIVCVSGRGPSSTWSEELAFVALPALRAASVPLPARVTGIWPESGDHRMVELDQAVLERAVDRVLEAMTTLVDARLSSLAAR